MKASVQDLLAGPRGRRLCLEATRMLSLRVAELVFWLGYELDPGRGTSLVVWSPGGGALEAGARPAVSIEQVAQAMADLDLSGLTEEVVQAALVGTVMSARYWQEPDGEDVLAGHPAVQAALEPVAEGVLGSAVARHWGSPRAAAQWVIDWRAFEDPAPVSRDAQGVLAAWAREERRQEVRAATEHPADPTANFSGTWWSIPQGAVVSVGQIPAGLDLVEDDIGAEAATVIDPGSSAAVLVWENAWAAPFATAVRKGGGQLVASGRIPVNALLAQLDAADEAAPAAPTAAA